MQLDLLVSGDWQHLDLVAQGMGSIGKASYGAGRSVRRLLVGRKTRNGAFSARSHGRSGPRCPKMSPS